MIFANALQEQILISDSPSAGLLCMTVYLSKIHQILPMLVAITADQALGRVDYHSLSDQTMMELFIENLIGDSKRLFESEEGMYRDVCLWDGVTCNDEGRVVAYTEPYYYLYGTASFSFLPRSIRCFNSKNISFQGTIDTDTLPECLEAFTVSKNKLSGTIDFTSLPESLIDILLDRNAFNGSCNFTSLPQKLRSLLLEKNRFSGSVSLTKLPDSLERFDLSSNAFCGTVDFSKLPKNLHVLRISENAFEGAFCLLKARKRLCELMAHENKFSGDAVVLHNAKAVITLQETGVETVLDENGKIHPKEYLMLD